MPKFDHPNFGDVSQYSYEYATITGVHDSCDELGEIAYDTADINMGGTVYSLVPIYFHCSSGSEAWSSNGALKNSSSAFAIDDEVIVRCKNRVPFQVVSFKTDLKRCLSDEYLVILLNSSGSPNSWTHYLIWDIANNYEAKIDGLPDVYTGTDINEAIEVVAARYSFIQTWMGTKTEITQTEMWSSEQAGQYYYIGFPDWEQTYLNPLGDVSNNQPYGYVGTQGVSQVFKRYTNSFPIPNLTDTYDLSSDKWYINIPEPPPPYLWGKEFGYTHIRKWNCSAACYKLKPNALNDDDPYYPAPSPVYPDPPPGTNQTWNANIMLSNNYYAFLTYICFGYYYLYYGLRNYYTPFLSYVFTGVPGTGAEGKTQYYRVEHERNWKTIYFEDNGSNFGGYLNQVTTNENKESFRFNTPLDVSDWINPFHITIVNTHLYDYPNTTDTHYVSGKVCTGRAQIRKTFYTAKNMVQIYIENFTVINFDGPTNPVQPGDEIMIHAAITYSPCSEALTMNPDTQLRNTAFENGIDSLFVAFRIIFDAYNYPLNSTINEGYSSPYFTFDTKVFA